MTVQTSTPRTASPFINKTLTVFFQTHALHTVTSQHLRLSYHLSNNITISTTLAITLLTAQLSRTETLTVTHTAVRFQTSTLYCPFGNRAV